MNYTRPISLCVALLLFSISGVAQTDPPATFASTENVTASNGAKPEPHKKGIVPCVELRPVEDRLRCYAADYKSAQWRFSWAYHFFVYGAAILSAIAALLTKIHVKLFGLDNATRRDNTVATLAAVATLFIAISTAGKLGDSWQDNKAKRYSVEGLLNQFLSEQNPTPEEIEAYGKRLAIIINPTSAPVEPKPGSPMP